MASEAGSGHKLVTASSTLRERFEEKYEVDSESGCWVWTAYINQAGYGQIGLGTRQAGSALAHRVAYELYRGAIPGGLELDHLCRVRCCVNPWHLEPVSRKENIARGDLAPGRPRPFLRKIRCPKGHLKRGSNLRVLPNGEHRCRTCERESQREYARRKREATGV